MFFSQRVREVQIWKLKLHIPKISDPSPNENISKIGVLTEASRSTDSHINLTI